VHRGVIFDLDDTLVDQRTAAGAGVTAWAAEHGIGGDDVIRRWDSISDVHYSRYQRRELTFAQQRRARVREFLSRDLDDAEADELFSGYLRRYEAGWAVFDDAVPALRRARQAGLAVVVLTNGDETHQRFKLDKLGLADEIDVMVSTSSLPASKPDPIVFLHAVRAAGVTAADAVMVGNSLDKDVRGALAAGLDAVLLDRQDVHPDADVNRIRSLDELDFGGLLA
jgi:putative hydrolase of the HAD superfamily